MKGKNNIKIYLGEHYYRYLRETERMLEAVNVWAQRENFTFTLKELLESLGLFKADDRFIYGNYWKFGNNQLNMLVRHHVLRKQKQGSVNVYHTRMIADLLEEYKNDTTPPHTHQAPHIFTMRYWERPMPL